MWGGAPQLPREKIPPLAGEGRRASEREGHELHPRCSSSARGTQGQSCLERFPGVRRPGPEPRRPQVGLKGLLRGSFWEKDRQGAADPPVRDHGHLLPGASGRAGRRAGGRTACRCLSFLGHLRASKRKNLTPHLTLSIGEVPALDAGGTLRATRYPQGHKRRRRPGVGATPGSHQRGSKSGLGPATRARRAVPTPL